MLIRILGNYFGSHFIMGGERFDTPQPEAYLFGENADLNFLGSRPTPVRAPGSTFSLRRIYRVYNFFRSFSFPILLLRPTIRLKLSRVWWTSERSLYDWYAMWRNVRLLSPASSITATATRTKNPWDSISNSPLTVTSDVLLLFTTSVRKKLRPRESCKLEG